MSIAAFAVFRSIRHHLMKDNTTDIDVPKNIYLYPHHYPLALLSYLYDAGKERISFTRPLSKIEAKEIQIADLGYNRFTEYTNSVYYHHNLDLGKTDWKRERIEESIHKQTFLRSPCTLINEL